MERGGIQRGHCDEIVPAARDWQLLTRMCTERVLCAAFVLLVHFQVTRARSGRGRPVRVSQQEHGAARITATDLAAAATASCQLRQCQPSCPQTAKRSAVADLARARALRSPRRMSNEPAWPIPAAAVSSRLRHLAQAAGRGK